MSARLTDNRRLRVAVTAGPVLTLPAPRNAGLSIFGLTEQIAQGLAARGHSVDVYVPEGSALPGVNVIASGPPPAASSLDEWAKVHGAFNATVGQLLLREYDLLTEPMVEKARRGGYDALYFAHPMPAMGAAMRCGGVSVVVTLHNPLELYADVPFSDVMRRFPKSFPNLNYVTVSDSQRAGYPELPFAATVHNGVDTDLFAFEAQPAEYFLHVGRIVPSKGVDHAIEAVRQIGGRLIIAGPIYDQEFFDATVKPQLDDRIVYVGPKTQQELVPLFQGAAALVQPSRQEGCSMTLLEAGSCGTPVVSYPAGGTDEQIRHGETGFVVADIAQLVAALGQVDTISRRACRDHIEQHFSVGRMVDGYQQVFREVAPPPRRRPSRRLSAASTGPLSGARVAGRRAGADRRRVGGL